MSLDVLTRVCLIIKSVNSSHDSLATYRCPSRARNNLQRSVRHRSKQAKSRKDDGTHSDGLSVFFRGLLCLHCHYLTTFLYAYKQTSRSWRNNAPPSYAEMIVLIRDSMDGDRVLVSRVLLSVVNATVG